jgi:mRNA interferase MazF
MGMVIDKFDYKQYDIFVFDPNPTKGHEVRKIRPCVIVSPDELNNFLATVIIAPLTTKVRNYPFRPAIKLGKVSGSIMLDQIRCIDKSRLTKRIGELSHPTIISVKNVLKEMFVD